MKSNLSQEEANQLEIKYIKQYNSTNNKYGYNLREGGKEKYLVNNNVKENIKRKLKGHKISEETKIKISKANKGKESWSKGKHLSEEHKQHISQSKKNKNFSESHRKKLCESHSSEQYIKGIKERNGQPVQCIETGDIFICYQDAANWCGLKNGSSIAGYFLGKQKSAGKHPITGEKLHWIKIDK